MEDCGPPLPVAEEGGTESPQPHRFSGRLKRLHGNGKCGKVGKAVAAVCGGD